MCGLSREVGKIEEFVQCALDRREERHTLGAMMGRAESSEEEPIASSFQKSELSRTGVMTEQFGLYLCLRCWRILIARISSTQSSSLLIYSCCVFGDGSWSRSSLNVKQEVSFVSRIRDKSLCVVHGSRRADSYALG
jgi:hypothetical protein